MSPIRFHNSVHNAAAGYWTIGTDCHEPYTALSAFEDTFGEGLLEALSQAACRTAPVLLRRLRHRSARTRWPPSCRAAASSAPRVVVSPHAGPRPAGADSMANDARHARTQPSPRNAEIVGANSMAGCLPLFEALACAERRTLQFGLSPTMLLETELAFDGDAAP